MGGIITIAKGHDASYPWRQIGTVSGERAASAAARGVGSYYLSPAEKGGEPPGIWTGKGGTQLGLMRGTIVDRAVFEPLYGQHLDPRDPTGQARLGRAPGQFQPAQTIYEAMLLAEPEATAERLAELMIEAKSRVRTPDLYWDATFSVSKSISLLHASALANAAAAADRGDLEEAGKWQRVAQGIWDAIMEGNSAALDYLQCEAGQTRAGYHPGGRWEDAREWVIASFRQHTSRDGDPQLHVHNLILHKVRRESDDEWRALDSMSLYRQRPAASAIAALVAENSLTARFGVRWLPRKDGHGREIAGVDQALMDMFSSRRHSMNPVTARLAKAYEAPFGRAPDARALTSIRQWANHVTRRAKEGEPLDMASLVRRWAAQACAGESEALEPLAPAVMKGVPAEAPHALPDVAASERLGQEFLSEAQAQRLIQEAVVSVQAAKSAWTKADLIRHLGERLPAQASAMDPDNAAAILPELARRALTTDAVMLSAPEWPRVPDCLRRASGESHYVPHAAERYATEAQLALEDRMLVHARESGAPRLEPAQAAQLLGADQARLETLLSDPAPDADALENRTGSGLRADQAAAAYLVLTSARRVEVLAGPAGSGKTTTVAEMARMWREAGIGPVIGLATSQSAANVLSEAGIADAFNTARFLGHLEGQRGALGPHPVAVGSLLILDEASMMSLADIAAIVALARERGSKVVVTGDHYQLAAVEGGGAMALLARRLGFVQLAEPQRFAAAWERRASLGLRAGDRAVLRDYEQHARLRGGTPDEATEQAYRGWLADYLDGKDTILIARSEDQVRELSRRARQDLIRYGLVDSQQEIRLACGQQAGAGDLVVARRNARLIEAGDASRELANRDVLRMTGVSKGGGGLRVEVRRLAGRDPKTGEARWSATFLVSKRYLADHGSLAYAATQHSAIGRTADTAHVLVDGLGDRQGLYVAMSRGRDANYAYCVTEYVRAADVRAGSRPDPELDRFRRLRREQAGLPDGERAASGGKQRADPVSVMAVVLARDGSELTATETLERELSRADSLAVLGAIWDDVTRRAQVARFERALRATLPARLAEQALSDPACTWLWRTLRWAEAAGLDGGDVLRRGVAARSMNGVRDPARVLDSRLRRMLDGVQPQVPGAWRARIHDTGSPDLDRYLAELAEAMDERTRRLGGYAALTQPPWACAGLGPVPDDPANRADWEQRASVIAAYRERYGYNDPADPIGPAPGRTSPEAHAAWHAALAMLAKVDGQDLRSCRDGELWLHRSGYERETAWAPPYVAEELRLMRLAQRDAHVVAVRAEHETPAAADRAAADRQLLLAQTSRALEAKAATEADIFARVQETRGKWQQLTEPILQLAIAADAELRRRHPGMTIEPLRPHPAEAVCPGADATDAQQSRPGRGPSVESAQHQALGLSPTAALADIPPQVQRIADNARRIQDRLDEMERLSEPGRAEVLSAAGVFAMPRQQERDAILHPPAHELAPSARILRQYQAGLQPVTACDLERG